MNDIQSHKRYCENFLRYPRLAGEPLSDEYRPFQLLLDAAYRWKGEKKLDEAHSLLQRGADLPKNPYQGMRAACLEAAFYSDLDEGLNNRRVADRERAHDPLGTAIEYYASAAEIARQLQNWALGAWFKSNESDFCYASNPHRKRYQRSFDAARDALAMWQQIPDRMLADDLHFEFQLADDVGVRAQMVGRDTDAVEGMEQAATVILKLRDRKDRDNKKYLNSAFFLDWDWAALNRSRGKLQLALIRALDARKQALNSSSERNYGRVNTLIAEIALDCVDHEITWERFEKEVLLNVAETAKDEARTTAERCGDKADYVLALLVESRWLRRTPWRKERHAILKDAEERALAMLDVDPILYARVEIAWGDEYTFLYTERKSQRRLDTARGYFQSAEGRLKDVGALGFERIARRRLIHLHQLANSSVSKAQRRALRKAITPPPASKIIYN